MGQEELASLFGCRAGCFPSINLGFNGGKIKEKIKHVEEENLMRVFVGKSPSRKKIHLVNWVTACEDKKYGELGIRNQEEELMEVLFMNITVCFQYIYFLFPIKKNKK